VQKVEVRAIVAFLVAGSGGRAGEWMKAMRGWLAGVSTQPRSAAGFAEKNRDPIRF